jgi:hypothetical protein
LGFWAFFHARRWDNHEKWQAGLPIPNPIKMGGAFELREKECLLTGVWQRLKGADRSPTKDKSKQVVGDTGFVFDS